MGATTTGRACRRIIAAILRKKPVVGKIEAAAPESRKETNGYHFASMEAPRQGERAKFEDMTPMGFF